MAFMSSKLYQRIIRRFVIVKQARLSCYCWQMFCWDDNRVLETIFTTYPNGMEIYKQKQGRSLYVLVEHIFVFCEKRSP